MKEEGKEKKGVNKWEGMDEVKVQERRKKEGIKEEKEEGKKRNK